MAVRRVNREAVFEKIGYVPHGKQRVYHASTTRFKVPVCGRRFGKSKMAAAEALVNKTYNMFMEDTRGWIIGRKYVNGEKEFRYLYNFLMRKFPFTEKIKKQIRSKYNPDTGDMWIEMPWGARVDVMSAQYKDTLIGDGLHWMIISESAKQDSITWDMYLRSGLNDYVGWATFPSTPQGYNWYYDLAQLGVKGGEEYNPEYETWNFPAWENPHVYPGGFDDPEIQGLLKTMPEDLFWQEIGASFRSMVGLIYTEFDDDKHLVDNYEYRPDWPNYLFFDFGFTNPFVALDVQISPSDDVFIWRERYKAKMTVGKHISEMKHGRQHPEGYDITCGFGDAADPGAVEEINSGLCACYAEDDAKDWSRGIREVKRFLVGEDEKPHIFIDRSCFFTIKEFQTYRIKTPSADDINPQEQAHKWDDHAMDAIRYGLMHIFVLGHGRYSIADLIDIDDVVVSEEKGMFTHTGDSVFTMGEGGIKWN